MEQLLKTATLTKTSDLPGQFETLNAGGKITSCYTVTIEGKQVGWIGRAAFPRWSRDARTGRTTASPKIEWLAAFEDGSMWESYGDTRAIALAKTFGATA